MTEKVNSAGAERRRTRRFAVDWDIILSGKDELGRGIDETSKLVNLSSRGAFVYLKSQLRVGMKLKVWIRAPLEVERWMAYAAKVVRIQEDTLGFGIGMKFSNVRPSVQATPPNGAAHPS